MQIKISYNLGDGSRTSQALCTGTKHAKEEGLKDTWEEFKYNRLFVPQQVISIKNISKY